MAYDPTKLTRLAALKKISERMKSEIQPVATAAAAAIKSGSVSGNTVSLFTSTDGTGAAAFTFDFPAELFLDQVKTQFVDNFAWSEETYPGSVDPSLEGKPVMVLAVKGDGEEVTYSFLSMAALVDTYSAKTTGKDASTTIEIAGYEIDVKVNISTEAGNQLQLKADGLYVPAPEEVDISGKADKVTGATEGNFAVLDAEGNLVDSGKNADSYSKVEASETNGNVKVDGAEVTVYTEPEDVVHGAIATDEEVDEMLDEAFGTTTEA